MYILLYQFTVISLSTQYIPVNSRPRIRSF